MVQTRDGGRKEINGVEYLIDTNIFLEFLLRQDRAPESKKLMDEIQEGAHSAYVTVFALHSIEVILDGAGKRNILSDFLETIEQAKGLTIYPTSITEEQEAMQYIEKFSLDFDDALQYYVAHTLHLTLVSFDHDFQRTDVKRVEPYQISH
jgi:predicted nucleic acid-binding protein